MIDQEHEIAYLSAPPLTIEQMKEACIEYETAWLMDCNDGDVLGDLLRNGWKGWSNMPDDAVIKFYKDNIEEEV